MGFQISVFTFYFVRSRKFKLNVHVFRFKSFLVFLLLQSCYNSLFKLFPCKFLSSNHSQTPFLSNSPDHKPVWLPSQPRRDITTRGNTIFRGALSLRSLTILTTSVVDFSWLLLPQSKLTLGYLTLLTIPWSI